MGLPENKSAFTQDYTKRGVSARATVKHNNWVDDEQLNEKIVQTIVTKLGYTESEVRKYVRKDKNSFVGVLYQKLLNDQNSKFDNSTNSMNDISAKLPIQPSFVPSVGSMTHLNLNSQMSKLSLNGTNQFERSREQLLATSNSNFNLSGTLANTLKFYTQP